MSEHTRFRYRSLEQLQEDVSRLGLGIPFSPDPGILGTPVRIASHVLANRFAVHPMEGFDASSDGSPGPLTFRRYRRHAEGGAALIWFEATAVLPEARSNPAQLWLHEGNVKAFAELVAATRKPPGRRLAESPSWWFS